MSDHRVLNKTIGMAKYRVSVKICFFMISVVWMLRFCLWISCPLKLTHTTREITMCVSCILLLDAGSHWMPRFWARLWDRDPAMAKLLPYCEHSRERGLFTCSHAGTLWYVWTEWCSVFDSKPDLIDSYSTVHWTHASEVRCAASAVVERHISAKNSGR